MSSREFKGVLTEISVLAGDSYLLRFQPKGPLFFRPGQFLSLKIPLVGSLSEEGENHVWRVYSFATSLEFVKREGCELFIRPAVGGKAAAYLSTLKVGDEVAYRAPFGEFQYRAGNGRPVVFISTGTGLAPIRSIARSKIFLNESRPFSLAVVGFKNQAEIPYLGEFQKLGIETRYALSRSVGTIAAPFFQGRVTDFLKKMSDQFMWRDCDYYICGNAQMIQDVRAWLSSKQVAPDHVYYEAFESNDVQIRKKSAA